MSNVQEDAARQSRQNYRDDVQSALWLYERSKPWTKERSKRNTQSVLSSKQRRSVPDASRVASNGRWLQDRTHGGTHRNPLGPELGSCPHRDRGTNRAAPYVAAVELPILRGSTQGLDSL